MLAAYVHDLDPFLWQWSENWGIRYYSLAYILGFLAAWGGLVLFRRWGWARIRPGEPEDMLTWLVIGTLVGGRLGYGLFYDFPQTMANPLSLVAFWQDGGISGMSSHGGFIGIILAIVWFAKKRGHSFWHLADNVATLAPVGIFFGRVANFINGELWGRPTDVPWAVIFPAAPPVQGVSVPRHPSQLYEAFGEGLLLLGIMLLVRRLKWADGYASLVFVGTYAVVRFVVEFYREPDVHLGLLAMGLTMGQWLSIGLLVGVAGLLVWRLRSEPGR